MPKQFDIFRDPRVLREHRREPTERCLAVGLDLGTNMGFAYDYFDPQKPIVPDRLRPHMGVWDLSAGPYDSGAIRFVRLRRFLEQLQPDIVFYEDVKNDPAQAAMMTPAQAIARVATASELLGAFKATVCTWCEERDIPCTGFKIATIKKRATNKGNAGKELMIAACNQHFGSNFETEGYATSGVDNVADAAWVLLLGLEQYADGTLERDLGNGEGQDA